MRITAAVLRVRGGPFVLEEVELDEPRPDEVLVRVVATGVCHTDLSIRDRGRGPLPMVLGHEGAGIVARTADRVSKVQVGDHVVLSFSSCGACPACWRGRPSYCRAFLPRNFGGTRPDGSTTLRHGHAPIHGSFFGQSSFATHALAAERDVVTVRRDVPLEWLGPLGCGIQTGAGAVLNALCPRPGSSLAVLGTGSVGLSAIMAARVAGCTTIIAIDVKPERLALARELGATHAPSVAGDLAGVLRAITGGGVDYALDTTGRPEVIRQAVDALANEGVCGLVGGAAPGTDLGLDYLSFMLGGKSVRGIVEGDSTPDPFIPALVDLHAQGRFPLDRLVTFYPFREINEAAAASEHGTAVKPVLRMDTPQRDSRSLPPRRTLHTPPLPIDRARRTSPPTSTCRSTSRPPRRLG